MTDYLDLVHRLRSPIKHPQQVINMRPEAADAIEAQAKRIEELEAALKPFVPDTDMSEEEYTSVWNHHLIQARKVLEGK